MKREIIIKMRDYYAAQLDRLIEAQIALTENGGVKSYTIGDRSLTRYDLGDLQNMIDETVKKLEEYDNILNGKPARVLLGVVPTDF